MPAPEPVLRLLDFNCPPGYGGVAHAHTDQKHFTICLEGTGELTLKKGGIPFGPGTLMMVPAGIEHGFYSDISYHIFEVRFADQVRRGAKVRHARMHPTEADFLYLFFTRLRNLYGDRLTAPETVRQFAAFKALALEIAKSGKATAPIPLPLRKAQSFIVSQSARPLSVEEVARSADTSPRNLHHLFRMHLNQTPQKYMERIRMDHAKTMLLEGRRSMKEIAGALGMRSQSYFTQVFRRVTGTSPTEFVKKNRAH